MLEFANQTDQVTWPSVTNPWASAIGCLLYQFEQTQWLNRRELEKRQWPQIQSILNFAYSNSSLYRKLYDEHGIDPSTFQNLDDLLNLPIVSREQLQRNADDWFCKEIPKGHGQILDHFTSGSTGRPLHSRSTNLTHLIKCALMIRSHSWAARDLKQSVVYITEANQTSEVKHSSTWESATKHVLKTGRSSSIPITMPVDEMLRTLRDLRPAYLIAYPSVIDSLMNACTSLKSQIPSLRQLGTFGEVLTERTRRHAKEEHGLAIFDNYSASELGPIAVQCSDFEHYHVQSEAVFVEILNDDNTPSCPGHVGRVVVTSHHNLAAPMIRYELGDLVEVGEDCKCGRGLPVLTKIIGRQRNLFRYPDGTRRWPKIEHDEFASFCRMNQLQIDQFQLAQISIEQLILRLVVRRQLTEDDKARIARFVDQQLGTTSFICAE